ncbi:MAG TPA: DUF481 domain-containing protein [Gammaproteobacteria bacterium]|nr:DUF481 domain-containing protein [Gammaproteobacteria bacterium]
MPFKYFPRHICIGLLLIVCILPGPGHTQPLFVPDITTIGQPSRAFTNTFLPENISDAETHYDLGSDIFAFSALRHEQTDLGGYESAVTAGFGRHLLNRENLRLDVNLGVGQRIIQLRDTSPAQDPIARLGLRLTIQAGNGPLSLRHDLVIETERSSTTSESMTTWSYAVNPRLDLELTSAARKKSRNPSADPLEVRHRASFTLNWAF